MTDSSNWRERNPDVLSYDQVTGCDTNIREKKEELMTKDADGKEKSYTPPRYSYEYDFCMTLYLRSPYFDHVFFELISNVKEEPPALGFLVPNWHSDAYKKAEAELKEAEEFIRGLNAPAENPQ